ncbi:hypothetical protein BB560_004108 [Smittium megazygosporum]|uniref:PIH1 N-terminal domain-containing protein n=1 Tax=Smittium megazygosporum TaxID=133381 RepID=A0A2T9ZA66_9FUNG|nr:hypothetical protein BB560_004108 [Smittium megazygosporum]
MDSSNPLLAVGDSLRKQDLHELNEALKKEIVSSGHTPYTSTNTHEEVPKQPKPVVQSKLEYSPFISLKTLCLKGKILETSKMCINLCFSQHIPKPPAAKESEIQKAFNGDSDATWQVPMYVGLPKSFNDVVVIDCIANSSLSERCLADNDTLLYLFELSLELIEDKYSVSLDRKFSINNEIYFGSLSTHYYSETTFDDKDY